MNEFEKVKIKELGKIVTGNTPVSTDETNYGGKYPFIKPTDMIIDQKHVFEYDETYSEKSYQRFHRSYIPKGATGVVTIGTVGEKMFQAHEDCFTNQSVNCIIPDDKYFDKDYVFYLMKFNLPKVKGANPGTASGRHHVSKSNFSSIKVDVTKDLSIQKKIAKILSKYDNLIENNLKRIKLLEESARLTYEEWYMQRRINAEIVPDQDIKILSIKEMLTEYMNGGWGKEGLSGNYKNKAYVIRGTDIPDISKGNFGSLPLRFHTDSNLKPRMFSIGDIAIEMSNGNIGNVGRSFYFDEGTQKILNKPVMCASFCKMIKPKSRNYSYIIDLHLKYIHSTNKMLVYKSQGANGINNFRFEDMINEEIISIPKDVFLNTFINKIEVIYSELSNLRVQIKLLKEARDILLPRLMTGMIDVTDMEIAI